MGGAPQRCSGYGLNTVKKGPAHLLSESLEKPADVVSSRWRCFNVGVKTKLHFFHFSVHSL